jgi:hypothetical protein
MAKDDPRYTQQALDALLEVGSGVVPPSPAERAQVFATLAVAERLNEVWGELYDIKNKIDALSEYPLDLGLGQISDAIGQIRR